MLQFHRGVENKMNGRDCCAVLVCLGQVTQGLEVFKVCYSLSTKAYLALEFWMLIGREIIQIV